MAIFKLQTALHHELIIKKSTFIASIYPIDDKNDVQKILEQTRKTHPEARHICSVFILPFDSSLDDDGEPKGTAAKPMFNVLQHKQLSNILAIVVRYFGGIKLGAGGLTRAYSQAVSQALTSAIYIEQIKMQQISIQFPFELESFVRHFCEQQVIKILKHHYAQQVEMQLLLQEALVTEQIFKLNNQTQGRILIQNN